MEFPHTKEETSVLIKMAVGVFNILKDNETLAVSIPLRRVVSLNGESPMGTIIFSKSALFSMIQAKSAPPPGALKLDSEIARPEEGGSDASQQH